MLIMYAPEGNNPFNWGEPEQEERCEMPGEMHTELDYVYVPPEQDGE